MFLYSGPSTIPRFVVSIVVDAVDALALGSLAHILKKIGKRTTFPGVPSVTNRDSAPTIILPISKVWVAASGKHILPNIINRGKKEKAIPMEFTINAVVVRVLFPPAFLPFTSLFGIAFTIATFRACLLVTRAT